MRIAVCDDDPAEQEQFDMALHGWDPTRSAEKFLSGAALLEAARETPPLRHRVPGYLHARRRGL